jgi:hypothetical protein
MTGLDGEACLSLIGTCHEAYTLGKVVKFVKPKRGIHKTL